MSIWPVLHYDDTSAALRFLVDLGFSEVVAARDDEDDVVHAEVSWLGGGRLVFGSTKHVESVHGRMRAGSGAVYVVTDDVEAVHARALAAGASVLEPPQDARFGSGAESRICTIADPEGNLWTFGTYR
ncbi:VOC family protein [Amycolatopsis endophytica]|uniref:Putative glyoxalase superfamily protein PhnB n=1 Tax=Amycolatopsis endophytica TaxID=860233 RepID=A0A853B400_9PSEU|nr:VOC family protein [Amycolatopsis endophytica]NYI89481.1 putative glyoxalase superfamily protein PhnB [Amycolatopsis endophytica]